jgi:hypothetical protein
MKVLVIKDKKKAELVLKYIIQRFYLALIYYTISSILFKSLVLSFYIILSRKIHKKN